MSDLGLLRVVIAKAASMARSWSLGAVSVTTIEVRLVAGSYKRTFCFSFF